MVRIQQVSSLAREELNLVLISRRIKLKASRRPMANRWCKSTNFALDPQPLKKTEKESHLDSDKWTSTGELNPKGRFYLLE